MKKIPSVVQLPGGVRLSGVPFKIAEYHDDGRPKLFEILERGDEYSGDGACVLFANESWIRSPVIGKAK